ncbi:hypothetical protein WR25_12439 [Diploscapter pachys]|uniref:TOG domain-containing protein n=1 Tax=Diploscapter pachys TaxID=2018661 RepID=A0A2A2JL78_9BILA|nr:hypothetical protein WR25_12439 [Diploscapter pachys]
MDPVDVTAKLSNKFEELLSSTKWQERIEGVELICSQLESQPRVLLTDRLAQVIKAFTKLIEKDVNINVEAKAATTLKGLAFGMRKDFASFVPKIMSVAFDKLKEKKATLREPLHALLDAASYTVSMTAYAAQIEEGLSNKNPQSRHQTAMFLSRLLAQHDSSTVPVEAIKAIAPVCIKISNDSDGDVRSAAFQVIAAIWRCIGEAAAKRLFAEVANDKLKMDKVMECHAKLIEEKGEKGASIEMLRLHTNFKSMPAAAVKTATSESCSGDDGGSASAASAEIDPWDLLDAVDLTRKLASNFDELLSSKKWQERIEAIESLTVQLEPPPKIQLNDRLADIIKSLIKVIEKDLNINVQAAAAKSLTGMSCGLRTGYSPFVQKTMSVSFDKLKEKKAALRDPLNALLDAVSNNSAPCTQFIDQLEEGLSSKNPQSRLQTALFLYRYLICHDSSTLPLDFVKGIAPFCIKAASDADGDVRNAILQVMAAVWRCIGEAAAKKIFAQIAEDKIKLDKLTECYTKLVEEKGTSGATTEIRRLHVNAGGRQAANASAQNSSAPKPTRPVASASARPSNSSRTSTAAAPSSSARKSTQPVPATRPIQQTPNRPSAAAVPRVSSAQQPRPSVPSTRPTPRPFSSQTAATAGTPRPLPAQKNALTTANRPNIVRTAAQPLAQKTGPVRVTASNGTLPGQVEQQPPAVVSGARQSVQQTQMRMPRERSDLQKGPRSTSIPRPSGIKPPSSVSRPPSAAVGPTGLRPPTVGLAKK